MCVGGGKGICERVCLACWLVGCCRLTLAHCNHLSCQKTTVDTWIKWSKVRVVAELLLVPNVDSVAKGKLPCKFGDVASRFMAWRKEQCSKLTDLLSVAKGAVEVEVAKMKKAKLVAQEVGNRGAEEASGTSEAADDSQNKANVATRRAFYVQQRLAELESLEQAIRQHRDAPRVPSVVVLFRENLRLTLGDIFGSIMGRTVEKEGDDASSMVEAKK